MNRLAERVRNQQLLPLVAAVSLSLVITACGREKASEYPWYIQEMKDAKAKWIAVGPRCYRMTLYRGSGLPLSDTHLEVTVCDRRVVAVTDLRADPIARRGVATSLNATVDGVFAEMEAALGHVPEGSIRASYDPQLGYPIQAFVTSDKFGYDTGATIQVAELQPIDCADCALPPPQEPPVPTTVCDVVADPKKYDDKLIVVTARVESDGLEGSWLAGDSCDGKGIVLGRVSSPREQSGIDDLETAIYSGQPGTVDKEITATFVGTFRWRPGGDPLQSLTVSRVSDVRMSRKH